jgi:hypothetical protein
VIWYFVTTVLRRPDAGGPKDDPGRIPDKRLARSEIGADEHRRVRDLIAGGEGTSDGQRRPMMTSMS